MAKTVMITGANGGLGKEAARQLAMIDATERIYLACRNRKKAEEARQSLEASTGRSIFEVVVVDALTNDSYETGNFYASKRSAVTGPLVDQGEFFGDLNNERYQDNACEALHRFMKQREFSL